MDEPPLWAARLREERVKRLWSQKGTAVRLRVAADDYTRARLPSVENIQRRVRGHESGQNHPADLRQRRFARAEQARDLRQRIAGFTTAASPAAGGGEGC